MFLVDIIVLFHSKVKQYLDNWPVAEWEQRDYSKICVMSPSATQVCNLCFNDFCFKICMFTFRLARFVNT